MSTDEYKAMLAILIRTRKDQEKSQEFVASQLGKPQSYISKIERGVRRIDLPELMWLAFVYGKPLEYFLTSTLNAIQEDAERRKREIEALIEAIENDS